MSNKAHKITDPARAQAALLRFLERDALLWRQHEARAANKISDDPVISFPDERPSSRRDSAHLFNDAYSITSRSRR